METGLTESTMLLWSVVLGLVQIVIATVAVNKDVGLPYNLSSRDEPSPAFGKVAGRLVRAGANFRETFGLFAVSVIMVIVLHRLDLVHHRPGDGPTGRVGRGLNNYKDCKQLSARDFVA